MHETEELNRARPLLLIVAALCVLASFVYVWIDGWEDKYALCPDSAYMIDLGTEETPVSYNTLLDDHRSKPSAPNKVFGCFALNVIALLMVLWSRTGPTSVTVFLCGEMMLGLLVCGVLYAQVMAMIFSCSWSQLDHEKTVEFGGNVFHLAVEYRYAGEIAINEYSLILYECDDVFGERCVGQYVSDAFSKAPETNLVVDKRLDQLHVMAEDDLVFTIDAETKTDTYDPH